MGKVIVTINPKTGERTYAIEGVVGGACEDLTKAIMQNNTVLDHQYTAEYCVPDALPDYVSNMDGSSSDE
jgi:hypothetical protein